MKDTIEAIEGMGPAHVRILRTAGIVTLARLLAEGGEPGGRALLARRTGIDETLILKWVNTSDLYRITGIAGRYVALLQAVGVETVEALGGADAETLVERMRLTNARQRYVLTVPASEQVAAWIELACQRVPVVT